MSILGTPFQNPDLKAPDEQAEQRLLIDDVHKTIDEALNVPTPVKALLHQLFDLISK